MKFVLSLLLFSSVAMAQVPQLSSVSPSSAAPNGAGLTLHMYGSQFKATSVASWNGHSLSTAYVSPIELTAHVPATYTSAYGVATVTVTTAGITSNPQYVELTKSASPHWNQFHDYWGDSRWDRNDILIAEDFNHDGHIDVLAGGVLYLGDGKGWQAYPREIGLPGVDPTTGPYYGGSAAADVNGDGNLDLVLSDGYNDIVVFLGNGDGTFQNPIITPFTLPDNLGAGEPKVADLNGDGKLDVVFPASYQTASAYEGAVVTMLGNGDGTFQSPQVYIVDPTMRAVYYVVVGDFNADGKVDVALTMFGLDRNGSLAVMLGNGDGTLQSPSNDVSFSGYVNGLATSDLNADGKLDLVVVGEFGVFVLAGHGDGTFGLPVAYAANYVLDATPDLSEYPVIADLNGDGHPDIVIGGIENVPVQGISGMVGAWFGRGDGTFQPFVPWATIDFNSYEPYYPPNLIAVADFDEDGRPDLFCLSNDTGPVATLRLLQKPLVVLSVPKFAFANQAVGTTSAVKTLTVTNTGSISVTISSITLTGTGAAAFHQSNNCTAVPAREGTCTVQVTFRPTRTGPTTATLHVAHLDEGNHTVSLSGTGI
jgi:hypothetical protein